MGTARTRLAVLVRDGLSDEQTAVLHAPRPGATYASRSFDLLFGGLELVTGGQRLHRYEDYLLALRERDQDPIDYSGYLQAFRYGMPPHGGFAIGLERWAARLTGSANIRETTLFPRDLNRLSP